MAGGKDGKKQARFERVMVEGDILSYQVNDENKVGVYISPSPITPDNSYFEVELLDVGFDLEGPIAIGLVPYKYNLDVLPGYKMYSVGYHTGDGRIYKARNVGKLFGPKCGVGDKVGCGIKYVQQDGDSDDSQIVRVFFTRNGTELGSMSVPLPPGGFHPAVGFHCEGEVRINNNIDWNKEDIILMAVDYGEEEWSRLHDVKLNGVVIEYAGRGKSILDVGLAQAKFPLDTTFHYFEIEIVDPGENCYIAIGVARQNYPPHRHPGWNRGSIAYHADDGKIFLGSGVGDPFGPKCHKGDIMGCGILFPPDYDCENDVLNVNDEDEYVRISNNQIENGSDSDDDEDDEEPWAKANGEVGTGTNVQVFFTRNGKLIGKRKTMIPKGGFYPTIGMLSSCERVRVDLRPLTG
ncbi:hypothetical protein LOTGIDRAFT_121837 [Lottia gigantea]|uniref:B30.2/SPRY domain-containing protein n=1 Tax=Lottia gigantea TaxID=225164 RepID=V4BS85_LOTGI|nr:hypothetical protein LOTGIDRAFT_121837 [Lottia gigantea]ESO91779.1 hypothetical protein LOTGIDRAFT_121837 [Lottia gigantea]